MKKSCEVGSVIMISNNAPFAVDMQHVYCKVGKKVLLQDIDWKIRIGERWRLYGDNGSGKTTLLSLIAGYGEVYSGKVKIFGQVYTSDNVFALRKRIGWVSASFFDKYYRNESVSDILLSSLSGSLGVRFDISLTDVRAAREELRRFELQDKFNALYHTLSKGEQQKVLLARALLQNPDMLLLDEPLSGLDASAEKYVQTLLKEIALNNQVTILYVSHHPEEFMDNLQYSYCLHMGKKCNEKFPNRR